MYIGCLSFFLLEKSRNYFLLSTVCCTSLVLSTWHDTRLSTTLAGHDIPDSWPVLITVTEGKDAPDLFLSWFVPPGTEPEFSDALVNVQHKNAATVYVR